MSDDRYRRRKDPYIGPDRDYPPNRESDYKSERDGDSQQPTYTHPYHDDHYGDRRDTQVPQEASHYASEGHNDRPRPQHERPHPSHRNQNERHDGYRERYPDNYSERNPDRNTGYDSDRSPDRTPNRRPERGPARGPNREPEQRRSVYPVRFHGKTSEYFKIWIVNVFLTVITLYIYSAWAKVRTKRYFYGNTTIDKSSFEYHATGRQLVVGRLIAAALLIAYTFFQGINPTIAAAALGILVVMFPWAIWRSLRFNARASSYRNIRFGFDGQASPPYVNIVIIPLLLLCLLGLAAFAFSQISNTTSFEELTNLPPGTMATIGGGIVIALLLIMGLVVPLLHKNLITYSLNNHRYGTARFSAAIKTGRIYGIHLLTIILSLIALMVVGAVLVGGFKLLLQSPAILDNSEILTRLEPFADIIAGVGFYLIAIPITGIAVAYFRSRIRNHRYNATTIGSRVQLQSTTTIWSLWWLNLSNLAMLILSLGLAYPFTKIRTARYFAARTNLIVDGRLDSFTEQEKTRLHAMGEEMADAFDVEFDIGI